MYKNKRIILGKYILRFSRLFFIVLFLYAGLTKLLSMTLFIDNLSNSPMLNNNEVVLAIAYGLPIIELTVSALLLIKKQLSISLYLVFFLLIGYISYLVALLFMYPEIPCNCRSFFPILNWHGHLYFTIGCTLLAIASIIIKILLRSEAGTSRKPEKE